MLDERAPNASSGLALAHLHSLPTDEKKREEAPAERRRGANVRTRFSWEPRLIAPRPIGVRQALPCEAAGRQRTLRS